MAGSVSLAHCLPTQGGADDGLNTAEDGESEGSGGAHLMPPANRHIDDVKLTGWLYKHRKGHFRQQWTRRFFVLRGTHLAYYKTSPWQQEVMHTHFGGSRMPVSSPVIVHTSSKAQRSRRRCRVMNRP